MMSRWAYKYQAFPAWVNKQYHNLVPLDTAMSKWGLFIDAKKEIAKITKIICFYLKNVDTGIIQILSFILTFRKFVTAMFYKL